MEPESHLAMAAYLKDLETRFGPVSDEEWYSQESTLPSNPNGLNAIHVYC